MSDMLSRYTPSRSLRYSGTELLTVPKARTKRHGEAAFRVYAPSLWNTLPEDLRMAETVETLTNMDLRHISLIQPIILCYIYLQLHCVTSWYETRHINKVLI